MGFEEWAARQESGNEYSDEEEEVDEEDEDGINEYSDEEEEVDEEDEDGIEEEGERKNVVLECTHTPFTVTVTPDGKNIIYGAGATVRKTSINEIGSQMVVCPTAHTRRVCSSVCS